MPEFLQNYPGQNRQVFKFSWNARCAALAVLVLTVSGAAQQASADKQRLVIGGYDPVSYFSKMGPQRGSKELIVEYEGYNYAFSSKENVAKFNSDPGRYIPQYGGNCAFGMVYGNKSSINPKIWKIIDGKLYLYLNAGTKNIWAKMERKYIRKAEAAWKYIGGK